MERVIEQTSDTTGKQRVELKTSGKCGKNRKKCDGGELTGLGFW